MEKLTFWQKHLSIRSAWPHLLCLWSVLLELSKLNHMRSHRTRKSTNYEIAYENTNNRCYVCGKECKSNGWQERHSNINKSKPNQNKMSVPDVCQISARRLKVSSLKNNLSWRLLIISGTTNDKSTIVVSSKYILSSWKYHNR